MKEFVSDVVTIVESPINGFSVEAINGDFQGKDFVSIEQLTSRSEIDRIFEVAEEMEKIVESKKTGDLLKDTTLVEIFYQPSTRTFTSFKAAALWLGCQRVIAEHGMAAYSSTVKGESLPDTIMSLEQTTACDVIVMRHPEDNSAFEAAHFASVPIISGGSGKLEHPTQAVLDLHTIQRCLGRIEGLKVAMLGDLRYGRTVKSLSKLLALVDKDTQLSFVSPEVLKMPESEVSSLESRGLSVYETEDLIEVLPEVDVLYVTRLQKEWFEDQGQLDLYYELEGQYRIDREVMEHAREDMIVMHPLPRVREIAYHVDDDPRSAYFTQMRSGLTTRMALLSLITGKV